MRLLLDTHFVIWLGLDLTRISPAELALIASPANTIMVSAVSIWEMRVKWRKNVKQPGAMPMSPADALNLCAGAGLQIMPLSGPHCAWHLHPALSHGDPFDEMLLAHAGALDARLLTRDAALSQHPLAFQRSLA